MYCAARLVILVGSAWLARSRGYTSVPRFPQRAPRRALLEGPSSTKDLLVCSEQDLLVVTGRSAEQVMTKFVRAMDDLSLMTEQVLAVASSGGSAHPMLRADMCSPRSDFIGFHDCSSDRLSELFYGNTSIDDRYGLYVGNRTIDTDLALFDSARGLLADFVDRQVYSFDEDGFYLAMWISSEGIAAYYPGFNTFSPEPFFFGDAVGADMDASAAPFFQPVTPPENPDRRKLWTAPYVDTAGGGNMITALAPLYLNGNFRGHDFNDEFVAALGFDILLDTMESSVVKMLPTAKALPMIVSDEGHLISASVEVVSLIFGANKTLADSITCDDGYTMSSCEITGSTTGEWTKLMTGLRAEQRGVSSIVRPVVVTREGTSVPHVAAFYRWEGRDAPRWNTVVLVPESALERASRWELPTALAAVAEEPGGGAGLEFVLRNTGTVDLRYRLIRQPEWLSISAPQADSSGRQGFVKLPVGAEVKYRVQLQSSISGSGKHTQAMGWEIEDDDYPDCFVREETLVELTFDVPVEDDGQVFLVITIVTFSLIGVFALVALVLWIARTVMMKRRLLLEREQALSEKVSRGLTMVNQFNFPMVLISAQEFVELSNGALRTLHEGVRDTGKLKYLDTMDKVSEFHMQGNKIVFFSYEWLSWSVPGPSDVQRAAMSEAVLMFMEQEGVQMQDVYVWLDILAIPQLNPGIKLPAINSLYMYASSVDALIIIAPEGQHANTGERVDRLSYKARVWTRVEQVAYASAHGLKSMYFYSKGGLEPVGEEWMRSVVCIFEANMTCCRRKHEGMTHCDRESLVLPLLALWYKVSVAHTRGIDTSPGTRMLHKMMASQRDAVFPRAFAFETAKGKVQHRVLFGDLIDRVDRRIRDSSEEQITETLGIDLKYWI